MTLRRSLQAALLLGVATLAACDSLPSGPGTVAGTVTGDASLGAVVLDVTWAGIQGFQGAGSTQAYSAPVADERRRFRLVLIDPVGGDLHFAIDVDDVYLEGPVVTVVSAADTNNQPMSVDGLKVSLER
jgi:hypothetical protein